MKLYYVMFALILSTSVAFAGGNQKIKHFRQAKRFANQIHEDHPYTIYCHCRYKGHDIDLKSCGYKVQKDAKRAARLEWEHVVPAEAFGQSFSEWQEGSGQCIHNGKKFKGRK